MHADGFFILRPDQHQEVGVAPGNGFVERVLDIVAGGKIAWLAHGAIHFWQWAATCSGVSLFRQSRWPSGHSRLKQGLQSRFRLTMSARSESGGVKPGDDEPYRATIGRSRAAATCISPESLHTTRSARASRSTAWPRVVVPHRLRHSPGASRDISSATA